MAKAEFYVYVHRRSDTGEVFYVGKGISKRAFCKAGRTEYWRRIAKDGYTVELLRRFEKEGEAFACEAEMIALYRAGGVRLTNFTDGGEGATGRIATAETKQKIAAKHIGKKMSPEAIQKMAIAKLGRPADPAAIEKTAAFNRGRKRSPDAVAATVAGLLGRPLSDEHREKLRSAWERRRARGTSEETRQRMAAGQRMRRLAEAARRC